MDAEVRRTPPSDRTDSVFLIVLRLGGFHVLLECELVALVGVSGLVECNWANIT